MCSNGPFETFLTQFENFFQIENFPWERIFMLAHWFLIQKKAQDVYFGVKMFLPQLQVFYLLFYWCITTIKRKISIWLLDIHTTIEGVKNFCEVKNFSLFDRVDFQLLPEEKINWIAWKLIILCGKEIE